MADVPVDNERVASLLSAAAAPSEPGPQPGEAAALAAFRASRPSIRRSSMRSTRSRTKIALAGALGTGLLLTGGVGAAMAGTLPGAAQDKASEVLAALGVEVPGADDNSAGHPDDRGQSEERAPATEEVEGSSAGKGEEVSGLARETDAEGVEKGAEVSGLASEGRSQAGQHGGSGEAEDARPDEAGKPEGAGEQAPVETPDSGGTGTADDASSGHSSAGSDNRP